MPLLMTLAADLLKTLLPQLLSFLWEKAHEPTTVEEAAPDNARRDRLLAAIRLRRSAGGNHPGNPTPPIG
jgi:hypothetical protein